MMDWQPIETAPKDGSYVLIFTPGARFDDIVVANYNHEWGPKYRWRGSYGDGDASWNPTHWMPLPEPPK